MILTILTILSLFHDTLAYTANRAVKAGHNIPHLTEKFQLRSNNFEISKDYFISISFIPLIILVVGILSLIVYILSLLSRLCFPSCRCDPKLVDISKLTDEQYNVWAIKSLKRKKTLIVLFIVALFMIIIPDHIILYGNSMMSKGIKDTGDSLILLSNIFDTIATSAQNIEYDLTDIVDVLDYTNCQYINQTVYDEIDTANSATSSIYKSIHNIAKDIKNSKKTLIKYGVDKKNLVIYIFYAFIMLVGILFIISISIRSKTISYVSITIAVPIILLLTIICSADMIAVTMIGDICINPTELLLKAVPNGAGKNTLKYYTECTGTNPLQDHINNMTYYTSTINKTIHKILDYNQCLTLKDTENYISDMLVNTNSIISQTECTPLYDVYNKAVNDGLCDNIYSGLFTTWISMFIISGGLFFIICITVRLYQFYGPKAWAIHPEVRPMAVHTDSIVQTYQPVDVFDNHVEMKSISRPKDDNLPRNSNVIPVARML